MKSAAHKNDPKWLGGLQKYTEADRAANAKDNAATLRNHGGDSKALDRAAYSSKGGK
jgi:hypothetical protein